MLQNGHKKGGEEEMAREGRRFLLCYIGLVLRMGNPEVPFLGVTAWPPDRLFTE